jgi:plasmid stabilization system protein ParE
VRLAWSNLATQELREVRRYSIDRWCRDAALRYIQDVRDAAKRVATDSRAARPLRGDLRIVRVRSHYLIVHVNEATSTATIVRVLHAAMDIERHLP